MRPNSTALMTLTFLMSSGCQPRPAPAPSTSEAARPAPTPAAAPAPSAPASAAEAVTGDATPIDADQPESDDPRVEQIRAKVREIQANQRLKKSELTLTCPGDEGSGKVLLFEGDAAVRRADLYFTHAGEGGEDKYQFYYDQGELLFVSYEMEGLSFIGTEQWLKTTQFRYYYHDGSPFLCTKKTTKVRLDAGGRAPRGSLASLLSEAPTEPDDCSRAGKAAERASLALLGPEAKDRLTQSFCPR